MIFSRLAQGHPVDENGGVISAYEILRISGKIIEEGNDFEALRWLTFGITEYPHDPRMHTRVAEIHLRSGQREQAIDHLWDNFSTHPSLETYRIMAEAADDLFPRWRRRAHAFLRKQPRRKHRFTERYTPEAGHSVLVDILRWENDADAAWRAGRLGGCRDETWLELARQTGKQYPEEAIAVFLEAAEHAIDLKSRDMYARAVGFLEEARPLYRRVARTSEFRQYLSELRETHKARKALLDELNRAGLP